MAETHAIRQTSTEELDAIFDVHRAAFGQDEEAELAITLLKDDSAQPIVSVAAYSGSGMVAHVLFTKVAISNAPEVIGSILCPLAVKPDTQNSGLGQSVVREGLRLLENAETDIVFVLGDPKYYGRFGFTPARAAKLNAPFVLPDEYGDAWMMLALTERAKSIKDGTIMCADTLSQKKYWVE